MSDGVMAMGMSVQPGCHSYEDPMSWHKDFCHVDTNMKREACSQCVNHHFHAVPVRRPKDVICIDM